jgi:signal transduction histidine kinase/ActR/RegA family two-component response regulator
VSERRAADGGTVILYSDITELKRKEEERCQLQEQFYRAQKMQAVGRLAGGIAHDFNNILAAILGNAHFLIEDLPKESEQHEFAQHIFSAAERAKHLVQQILAFSRQQNSEQALLDPDTLVAEAVQLLRATLPKTIDLNVRSTSGKLSIHGNQTQLVQVLMNLCVNARDAIGDAQGSINIDLEPLEGSAALPKLTTTDRPVRLPDGRTQVLVGTFDSSTPYFRITVRDTGCGIDFPVMERMFEPFFTTKDVGRGTGLGLSAVHGIIADHKGALLVTSKVGEGTAFELFFPLANAPQTATEVKDTALPKGAERVLVVDDEPQIARMTTKFLERLGYKAAACHSPLEALAEFERASDAWDLVITDQTMPHMTGTELAQKLLALKTRLPIILCSGFSEGLKETKVKELGLFSFLPKPVDQGELARMIRSALNRSAAPE